MSNDTSQKLTKTSSPFYALDARDQQAIDMKIDHYQMRVIAGFLGITYETCRGYFSEGGRLYEAYVYREIELSEDYQKTKEKVDTILKDGAIDAALTIRNAARQRGMTGVVAARDILDRTGFKPPDKLEHFNDPDNPIETVVIYLPNNGRQEMLPKTKGKKS